MTLRHGKEVRTSRGQPVEPDTTNEIMALMFVMVERAPGAFSLRTVSNDDLLKDLERQGMLETFLDDVDQLYAEFRKRFDHLRIQKRPN